MREKDFDQQPRWKIFSLFYFILYKLSLNLAFLCILQLIRMSFIFKETLDAQLMASSLAAMLAIYPFFAGRLHTSKNSGSGAGNGERYQVALCNKGASLTIATCDSQLQHILPVEFLSLSTTRPESFLYSAPDLSRFLPAIPSSILGYCNNDDVSLLHAQITHLQGGGTVLALVIPHLIADQETCRLCLKAWAEFYTAACIEAENSSGPIRMLSSICEEEVSESLKNESSSSSSRSDTSSSFSEQSVEGEASDSEPSSSSLPASAETSERSLSDATYVHSGHALEAHAAPSLPPNWTSLRFEKRSWSFYPSIACAFLWHVGNIKSGLSTVSYYVSATRLEQLKSEASQNLKKEGSEAPCAAAWISKNDALAARIRQVTAQISGKSNTKMHLWVNLRKRMVPSLPKTTLGNCSWPVAVSCSSSSSPSPNLGCLAAAVRAAIQTVNNQEYISQELRWLEDAFSTNSGTGGGSSLPCVFKNATDILKINGPLMLSHWDWGHSTYSDVQFGSSTPIWHQPPFAKVPNCVFVVPAAAVVAGGSGAAGVLVHLTLHKRVAEELKRICPAL
jgi:hypothetical protein